jgi:DNA helicase-2/ATP-dependent DNA helicase PcrA
VASRFAWVLVDEFQDTSAGQVAILRKIAEHKRTQFFLMGDPNQSIMGFAGARPNLMTSFPVELKVNTNLHLSGNYRCSKKIVDDAEALVPTNPGMLAVGEWKDCDIETEHVHTSSLIDGVFDHFLPAVDSLGIPLGEAAVLAPWWTTLYGLTRELRERGVPVRGPGARPYRYSNLFAGLAENLCAYVEQQDPDLFRATQRMLFIMLLNITGNPVWRVFSYEGRRCLCFILSSVRKLREIEENAVKWLRSAANVTAEFLVKDELITASQGMMIPESAEGMIANMVRNNVETNNLHVSDLALYARPKDCLRLITMHGAKGLEFDAVAIVDLHEGRVPDFRAIRDGNEEAIKEDKRQLYVAMTRPRKLLMYFTDSSHYRNRPSRFLKEIGIV